MQIGLGHLDVEPEHPVVADLERLDSGPLLLRHLHRRDRRAAALRELHQLVEVGTKARAHETRLATRRHFIDQRPLEEAGQHRDRAQRGSQVPQQRRRASLERRGQIRHLAQRAAQSRQIARHSLPHRQPPEETLYVQHTPEALRDLLAPDRCLRQLLHGILSRPDVGEVEQGRRHPAREQPPSRRRQRPVDDREQRPALAPVRSAEQLEVLRRAGIDEELPGRLLDDHAHHVLRGGALRLLEIRQRLRRRLDGQVVAEAEAIQRGDAEMALERLSRALRVAKRPGLHPDRPDRAEGRRGDPRLLRNEHFAGPDARQLVEGRLERPGREGAQLPGGRVEQGHGRTIHAAGERREPERVARLQRVLVDQRPRRDQPDDLAPDQLLARTRHLHLVADGDLVPGGDQTRDVGPGGVVRHPRHRDPIVALGPRSQSDAEDFRGSAGVVVEQLVEVAQAKEEQRVARLRLRFMVLPEHRRRRRRDIRGRM